MICNIIGGERTPGFLHPAALATMRGSRLPGFLCNEMGGEQRGRPGFLHPAALAREMAADCFRNETAIRAGLPSFRQLFSATKWKVEDGGGRPEELFWAGLTVNFCETAYPSKYTELTMGVGGQGRPGELLWHGMRINSAKRPRHKQQN